jgi:anti-sigma regulatory factor (Ser/Thr protein kinase)
MSPVEEMVLEVHSDAEASRIAREQLRLWADRHAPALTDDLALVVSELVTNATVHGPDAPIALHLRALSPARVEGEVIDQGDAVDDVAVRETADEDGGFGLRIVSELATAWGTRPGSTCVWFVLEA